jgi:hypothetical protein
VVSMCQISSARVVRMPTFGFAGCTRSRGRRHPKRRTRRTRSTGRPRPARAVERAWRACRFGRAVGRRGHHLFDDSDFSWRQSVRQHPRTGRLVVEGTRVLPLPSMEPARRQPKDPQERPQRNARAGLFDGAQDLPLGAAVWQPLPRQGESGGSVDGEHEGEAAPRASGRVAGARGSHAGVPCPCRRPRQD